MNNIIIPQRFVPFDLGTEISDSIKQRYTDYFDRKGFDVKEMPDIMRAISNDALLKVDIDNDIRLYIFSFGIGVFVLEDTHFDMGEKYSVDYCDYRKRAHKEILEFTHDRFSETLRCTINDLRSITKDKNKALRVSASESWEYRGLSYVMTVSYILRNQNNNYPVFNELEKKNLQIMLQPSIAHLEDTMAIYGLDNDTTAFDPFSFDINRLEEPKNWMKVEDSAVYISWAAVIVFLKNLNSNRKDIIECLEADLQAMWMYMYCQNANIKRYAGDSNKTVANLKREKYNSQKKYNEFKSDADSSIPVYIYEIRNELIRTSGLDQEVINYMEYLDFCIDETESKEFEEQKRYSRMNEILLFLIAFIQIVPMVYQFLTGAHRFIEPGPVAVLIAIFFLGMWFISRKD